MGEPADLVNGLIYVAEKDYINAGISMAAVIPVVGDAGKAVKYGAKAIEKSKGLKKIGKTVTKPLSKKATKTYQAGKKSFKKKADKIKVLSYREAEELAFDAIHGSPKAGAVVLGKYGDGGPTSYTSIAKGMDAQYFQLDNWEEIAEAYSEDEIWKINERFLDIQTSSGRKIYLSHNPEEYIGRGDFYSKELNYLQENGYKFVKKGDLWHAIR